MLPPAPVDPVTGISEWYKAAWSLPYFEQIDEGKEAGADKARWEIGQDSGADWAQQAGMSEDELLERRDQFIRKMQARAKNLNLTLREYMPGLFPAGEKPQAPVTIGGDE